VNIERLALLWLYPFLGLTLVASWNPGNYIPTQDEEIYGTWTNDRTYNLIGFQKTIISADGWKNYPNISDRAPWEEGTSQIDSKWTDDEGNIWYKIFGVANGGHVKGAKFQNLTKLSKSATVLEVVARPTVAEFDSTNYPARIDPGDPNYAIYYRASN